MLNMKIKVLTFFILFIVTLSGCAAKNTEIAVFDTFILNPSKYDSSYINNDDYSEDAVSRTNESYTIICRSRSEFIDNCSKAGIEPGYGIPDYTDEWFDDKALVILAFYESGIPHDPEQSIAVEKVISNGNTVEVYYKHTATEVILQYGMPYTIVIEVNAKSVKTAKKVVYVRPSFSEKDVTAETH